MKTERILSFAIIALVYVLAGAIGIFVYGLLDMAIWLKLLIADIAATVVVFIFSLIFKNASVYDPYWSVQPMVIILAISIGQVLTVGKIALIIAVFLWGIRLTANWAYTFKNLNQQDWRYTMLEQKTGKLYPIVNFFGIHLVPTLIVYMCILPVVYCIISTAIVDVWAIVFAIFAIGAVVLQGMADCQMHKFKKYRTTELFNRNGLWKYARHPNYLAEILMWWCMGAGSILAMLDMWWLIVGAIVNTLLFLFISIPMADNKQSVKLGYQEYKAATRSLLPLPKDNSNTIE